MTQPLVRYGIMLFCLLFWAGAIGMTLELVA
jgi:hypothetical protein